MRFVAPDLREEQIPCRFIELTGNGITVDSLYRCGTAAESEEALRTWLHQRIHELESELSDVKHLPLSESQTAALPQNSKPTELKCSA
jgi:hypothetical protein